LKAALVLGAGGFIGSHMVRRLKSEGFFVVGIDLKLPEFNESLADKFIVADLRNKDVINNTLNGGGVKFDEIYQLAADMGGAQYIFSGDNDAEVMSNSVQINLNLLNELRTFNDRQIKVFFSSSACIYPRHNQSDPTNPICTEKSAYPADPDSEYGWEKLFSERLFQAFSRNFGIRIAIARFHNIFGPEGTWEGGKEKAPAAICRKIASVKGEIGEIEVWGDGLQTRSFLYIDECIDATRKLMQSDFSGPVNIGSEEMVTINQLVAVTAKIAGKKIKINYLDNNLVGVKGRNSDNTLIRDELGWEYRMTLEQGISQTYLWIKKQLERQ